MTPKKAIIIVLILFLIMALVFIFLYLKRQIETSIVNYQAPAQSGAQSENLKNEPLKPGQAIEQKVEKIIEDASINSAQNNPAEVRQDIINTINSEIIKQEQAKNAEQQAADLKAQEDRQKIIDQINQQIKK